MSLRPALYNLLPLIPAERTYFLDVNKLVNYYRACIIMFALRKTPA